MNIDTLKHYFAKFIADTQNKYWPDFVHYVENNSPAKLFARALLIGLILSVPWQCGRLLFNNSAIDDPEKIQENNTSVMLPNFNSGSVTNMPNPKARRPIDVPTEPTTIAPEQPAQVEEIITATPSASPVQEAKIISQTAPEYPAAALRKREYGTVLLRVTIDAQGAIKDISVETSSSSRALDRAARKSVSAWKFSPKIENGIPVTSDILIPIEYKSE